MFIFCYNFLKMKKIEILIFLSNETFLVIFQTLCVRVLISNRTESRDNFCWQILCQLGFVMMVLTHQKQILTLFVITDVQFNNDIIMSQFVFLQDKRAVISAR